MNSPFAYMAYSLSSTVSTKVVNRKDYELFCKEFIFEKIKGEYFGNSFCKRFGINNYMISNVNDDRSAKLHIEQFYIK